MRRRDTYWSLFHTVEKRQLNDLRTEHVEAIFDAIPVKDRKDWVIWKEGFRSWKPLKDFPNLLVGLREQQQVMEAPVKSPEPPRLIDPDKTTISGGFEGIATGEIDLSIMNDAAPNERDTRYPKRWEVRLHIGGKILSNQTVNMSLHGMQLRDPAPAGVAGYFNVEIRAADMRIPVMCSVIPNRDGTPSHRLKIESNEYPDALQTALLQK